MSLFVACVCYIVYVGDYDQKKVQRAEKISS